MNNDLEISRLSLKVQGYAILKEAYNHQEIEEINKTITNIFDGNLNETDNPFTLTDAWNKYPTLLNWCTPKILTKFFSKFSDQEMCLLRHSDIHMNFFAGNFHRDSVCRGYSDKQGADWSDQDEYSIIRFACYPLGCQFEVIPGSNRTQKEIQIDSCILELQPGDLLAFDPRIMHRGVKPKNKKTSFFFAYGAINRHSYRHQKYYVEERSDLDYIPLTSDASAALKNKKFKVL